MPTPSENLRPLSTRQRFEMLASCILAVMPEYGYSGQVADFVLCQAALETGNFTSDLLLRANNAFGMRIANQRPQPRIGESNGYAVYDTLCESVADYFDRQRAFNIPNTNDPAAYMTATAASGYAEAARYVQAWRAKYDEVQSSDYETAFRLSDAPGDPNAAPLNDDGGSTAGSGLPLIHSSEMLLLLALWGAYEVARS